MASETAAENPTATPVLMMPPRRSPWGFLAVLMLLLIGGAIPLTTLVYDALSPVLSDPGIDEIDAIARHRIERSLPIAELDGWAATILARRPQSGRLTRELWLPRIQGFAREAVVVETPHADAPTGDEARRVLVLPVDNQPLSLVLIAGPSATLDAFVDRQTDSPDLRTAIERAGLPPNPVAICRWSDGLAAVHY